MVGSACDITLSHGTLCRQYLQRQKQDGQWLVEDLGSFNGTRLNDGDRIAAGRVRVVVRDVVSPGTSCLKSP